MNNNVNNKQSMNTDELYLLVATELSDTLTAEETKRLEEWKAAAPANRSLYERSLMHISEPTGRPPISYTVLGWEREKKKRQDKRRGGRTDEGEGEGEEK